ncbi:MAG TPA: serine/threonine-protein kinase [Terriglobales bacterium]|nr:serine/threonine-protein kinase [Terriglobales bacterium]
MIGKTIGQYRVDQKLGEGGMGVVYRATDLQLDRPVAIKMLSHIPPGFQREAMARFLREAKASSALQHPAILVLYQMGTENDTPYIVMEYVEGQTLKSIIGGRPMPIRQLCETAIQVASGLAAAHEKGIIHRDIKSQNIMVTHRGQAKIFDFGLAKFKEQVKSGVAAPRQDKTMVYDATALSVEPDPKEFKTQAGQVMGTASHMSPEQAMGAEVDTRTDIFSFGVMLYEMATGQQAFESESIGATLLNILKKEPRPAREVNPELPPELHELIHMCIRKQREERPSADEIVTRLQKIQAALSGRVPSGMRPAAPAPAAGVAAAAPTAMAVPPAPTAMHVPEAAPPPPRRTVAPWQGTRTFSDRTPSGAGTPVATPPPPASRTVAPPPAPPPEPRAPARYVRESGAAPPLREVEMPPPPSQARREMYWTLKIVRVLVSYGSMLVPFAFFLHFVVAGGLLKEKVIAGTPLMGLIQHIAIPVELLARSIVAGSWRFLGLDWLIFALGLLMVALRFAVVIPLERAERWAKGGRR